MNEIKISEFRFLQLCDIENKYYKNFHKTVEIYYRKFLKKKNVDSSFSFNYELNDEMAKYINSSILKLGYDYPQVWVSTGGIIMYWGRKDSESIHIK